MFDVEFSGLRRDNYKGHLAKLDEACSWLGITRGRARRYAKLLAEFHEQDQQTEQHVLAYHESCEIIDIFSFWHDRVDVFPGLKSKLSASLSAGPVLREEEKTRRSSNNKNRSRNDAFVYYLAGRLVEADTPVIAIDGILRSGMTGEENADITFDSDAGPADIQCKRPQSWRAFDDRIKDARRQIEAKNRIGVVAVDCSVLIRPPHHLLLTHSTAEALNITSYALFRLTFSTLMKQRTKNVLGFLLFARVPLITTIRNSRILDQRGAEITYFQRESISVHVLFNNRHSVNPNLLMPLLQRLKENAVPK